MPSTTPTPTVPNAPRDLTVVSYGNRSVQLGWSEAIYGKGFSASTLQLYRIYNDSFLLRELNVSDTISDTGSSAAHSYLADLTGLEAGELYYFSVAEVHNVSGRAELIEGNRSTQVIALVLSIPSAPEDFTVSPVVNGLMLTWDHPHETGMGSRWASMGYPNASSVLRGYRLKIAFNDTIMDSLACSSAPDLCVIEDLPSWQTSYTLSTLRAGTEYEIRLSAYNLNLDGVAASASSLVRGLPSSPRNASVSLADDVVLRIDWLEPLATGTQEGAVFDYYLIEATADYEADFSPCFDPEEPLQCYSTANIPLPSGCRTCAIVTCELGEVCYSSEAITDFGARLLVMGCTTPDLAVDLQNGNCAGPYAQFYSNCRSCNTSLCNNAFPSATQSSYCSFSASERYCEQSLQNSIVFQSAGPGSALQTTAVSDRVCTRSDTVSSFNISYPNTSYSIGLTNFSRGLDTFSLIEDSVYYFRVAACWLDLGCGPFSNVASGQATRVPLTAVVRPLNPSAGSNAGVYARFTTLKAVPSLGYAVELELPMPYALGVVDVKDVGSLCGVCGTGGTAPVGCLAGAVAAGVYSSGHWVFQLEDAGGNPTGQGCRVAVSHADQRVTVDVMGVRVGENVTVEFELSGVVNPRFAGLSPGTSISTYTVGKGLKVDSNIAIAGVEIAPGPLTASILFANTIAGQQTSATVNVSSNHNNSIPRDGRVTVTFPPGYHLAKTVVYSETGATYQFSVEVGNGTVDLVANETVEEFPLSLMLMDIENPWFPGNTSEFQASTSTPEGVLVDQSELLPKVGILAGLLSMQLLTSAWPFGGTTTVSVLYMHSHALNLVNASSDLILQMAPGVYFDGDEVVETYAVMGTNLTSEGLAYSFGGNVGSGVTLTVTIPWDTLDNWVEYWQIEIRRVNLPVWMENETASVEASVQQEGSTINATMLNYSYGPGILNNTSVNLESRDAGAVTNSTVSFVTTNPTPSDGFVDVILPRFSTFVSNVNHTVMAIGADTTNSNAMIYNDNTLRIWLNLDVPLPTNTLFTIKIEGVMNVGWSTNVSFALSVGTAAGEVIEQAAGVSLTEIVSVTSTDAGVEFAERQADRFGRWDTSRAVACETTEVHLALVMTPLVAVPRDAYILVRFLDVSMVSVSNDPVYPHDAHGAQFSVVATADGFRADQDSSGCDELACIPAGAQFRLNFLANVTVAAGRTAGVTRDYAVEVYQTVQGESLIESRLFSSRDAMIPGIPGQPLIPGIPSIPGQPFSLRRRLLATGSLIDLGAVRMVSALAGAVNDAHFAFRMLRSLPASSSVTLVFPADANLFNGTNGTNSTSVDVSVDERVGDFGNFMMAVTKSSLTIERNASELAFGLTDTTCVTSGGSVAAGTACSFPFVYLGVTYSSCTSIDNGGVPWCSTTTQFVGFWGNCACTVNQIELDLAINVNTVQNPPYEGTGNFHILVVESTPVSDFVIAQDTSLTFDFVRNQLSDVNVTLGVPKSGELTTMFLSFMTFNPIPVDGVVEVVLPPFFVVSGAIATGTAGFSGSWTVAQSTTADNSSTVLRLTMDAGAAEIGAFTQVTIAVSGVTVRPWSGLVSFDVTTYQGAEVDFAVADEGAANVTIMPNDMTDVEVTLAQSVVGATTTAVIRFRPVNDIPLSGGIHVTLPAGFTLDDPNLAPSWRLCGVLGRANITLENIVIDEVGGVLLLWLDAEQSIQSGDLVEFTLPGVTLRLFSGMTEGFALRSVRPMSPSGYLEVIDHSLSGTEQMLVPGMLSGAAISILSVEAGALSTAEVSFTNANPIPGDGRILVAFPFGFSLLSPVSDGYLRGIPGMVAVVNAQPVNGSGYCAPGCNVTLAIMGNDTPAGTAVAFGIANVENMPLAGLTGTYLVQTLTNGDVAIDQAIIDPTRVGPSKLGFARVDPIGTVGTAGNLTLEVGFTTSNPVPVGSQVTLKFSNLFNLSDTCYVFPGGPSANGSQCGEITVSGAGISPIIMVSDSQINMTTTASFGAETDVIFRIFGVKAPAVAGLTGTYELKTMTVAGVAIDVDLDVESSDIAPGVLAAQLDMNPPQAGFEGVATLTLVVTNEIPTENTGFELEFPPSVTFADQVTAVALSGLNGTLSPAVSGSVLSLTLANMGFAVPMGSTVVLSVSGIINPSFAGTVLYTVRTIRHVASLVTTSLSSEEVMFRRVLDSSTGASYEVVPALMQDTAVDPSIVQVGYRGAMRIRFRTYNILPADASIRFEFPEQVIDVETAVSSDFYAALKPGAQIVLADGFTCTTVDGSAVVVTRTSGSEVAAGVLVEVEITNVLVIGYVGSGGDIQVYTSTSDGNVIDQAIAHFDVSLDGILTEVKVNAGAKGAGTPGTLMASFWAANHVDGNSSVSLTLPAGAAVNASATCMVFTASNTLGTETTLTRSNAGNISGLPAEGDTLSVKLDAGFRSGEEVNITCMGTSTRTWGGLAPYLIQTVSSMGAVIDSGVALYYTEPGPLQVLSLEFSNSMAASRNDITVSFITTHTVPDDGRIQLVFPDGTEAESPRATARVVDPNANANNTNARNLDVSFMSVQGGVAVVRVLGGLAPFEEVHMTLRGIINRGFSGDVDFYVQTAHPARRYWEPETDRDGDVIDQNLTVWSIQPLLTDNATMVPTTAQSGARGTVTFMVNLTRGLDIDGAFTITFPPAFDVSSVSCNSNMDGSVDGVIHVETSGQMVSFLREGLTPIAYKVIVTVEVYNVGFPQFVTDVGSVVLHSWTKWPSLDGAEEMETWVFDHPRMYSAALGLPASLSGWIPEDRSHLPRGPGDVAITPLIVSSGDTVTLSFRFWTVNEVPAGGFIVVQLPPGFAWNETMNTSCTASDTVPAFTVLPAEGVELYLMLHSRMEDSVSVGLQCSDARMMRVTGTPEYEIKTMSADRMLIDNGVVPTDVVSSTLMPTVTLSSNIAGQETVATATFTLFNPLQSMGVIEIDFPAGFAFDGDFTVNVLQPSDPAAWVQNVTVETTCVNASTFMNMSMVNGSMCINGSTCFNMSMVNGSMFNMSMVNGSMLNMTNATGDASDIICTSANVSIPLLGLTSMVRGYGYDVPTQPRAETTVTLLNQGSEVPLGTTIVLQFVGLTNRGWSGNTGNFNIRTRTPGGVLLDGCEPNNTRYSPGCTVSEFANGTILEPADMLGADMQMELYSAGYEGRAILTFRTNNTLLNDSLVEVTFPSGFSVDPYAPLSGLYDGIDGRLFGAVSGPTVTVSREGGSDIPPGEIVRIEFSGVQNRKYSTCTEFEVDPSLNVCDPSCGDVIARVATATGITMDDSIISLSAIIPAPLNNSDVMPTYLVTGAVSTAVVQFRTVNPLPGDGKIGVRFPDGVVLEYPLLVQGVSGVDGLFTVTNVSGTEVEIERMRGTTVASGTIMRFNITGVRNRRYAGPTGTYQIRTRLADRTLIDAALQVSEDELLPGELQAVMVKPESPVAGNLTSIDVTIAISNFLPADGGINILLPELFDMPVELAVSDGIVGGSLNRITTTPVVQTASVVSGMDGDLRVDRISAREVNLTRIGAAMTVAPCALSVPEVELSRDEIAPGFMWQDAGLTFYSECTVTVRLTGVAMGRYAGATNLYRIRTLLGDGSTIDELTSSPHAVVPGHLLRTNVEPMSLIAGAYTDTLVTMLSPNGMPVDGRLQVVFPEGFDTEDVSISLGTSDIFVASGTVLQADSEPVFTVFRASTTSEVDDDLAQINIEFALTADLMIPPENGTLIVIGNLSSSPTPSGPIALGGPDSALFEAFAVWSQEAGTVTLVAVGGLPRETTYMVWFDLQNPTNSSGVTPTIEVRVECAFECSVMPPAKRLMDGVVLKANVQPMALQKNITSLNFVVGERNTITVVLIFNFRLSPGDSIDIVGLNNTLTPSTFNLTITGPAAGLFGNTAMWTQDEGLLSLDVAVPSIIPRTPIEFSFVLHNALDPRDALVPTLEVGSPIPLAPLLMDASNVLLTRDYPEFSVRQVTQNSLAISSLNLLTFTIRPTAILDPGTIVTIAGLVGSPTVDPQLLLEGPDAGAFEPFAQWDPTTAMLRLTVSGSGPAGAPSWMGVTDAQDTVVSVMLRNPTNMSSGVVPNITASKPRFARQPVLGDKVLRAQEQPRFTVAALQYGTSTNTTVAYGRNQVFVTLIANANLRAGSMITIAQLPLQLLSEPTTCYGTTLKGSPCVPFEFGEFDPEWNVSKCNETVTAEYVNATWVNGSYVNCTWGNGTMVNGTWVNGTCQNGTWVNGSWVGGTWINVTTLQCPNATELTNYTGCTNSMLADGLSPMGQWCALDPDLHWLAQSSGNPAAFMSNNQGVLWDYCACSDNAKQLYGKDSDLFGGVGGWVQNRSTLYLVLAEGQEIHANQPISFWFVIRIPGVLQAQGLPDYLWARIRTRAVEPYVVTVCDSLTLTGVDPASRDDSIQFIIADAIGIDPMGVVVMQSNQTGNQTFIRYCAIDLSTSSIANSYAYLPQIEADDGGGMHILARRVDSADLVVQPTCSTLPQGDTDLAFSADGAIRIASEPIWLVSSIGYQELAYGALTTITVTFQPNWALDDPNFIAICCFANTSSPNGVGGVVAIHGSDAAIFGYVGQLNEGTGEMVLTVALGQVVPCDRPTSVRFTLFNNLAEFTPPTVILSAYGGALGSFSAPIPGSSVNASSSSGNSSTAVSGFLFGEISSNSRAFGARNRITVVLRPQVGVDILPGSYITIGGLYGSTTPSATLPLSGPDAGLFEGMTGMWTNLQDTCTDSRQLDCQDSNSQLIVRVDPLTHLAGGEETMFFFYLDNKPYYQPAIVPVISSSTNGTLFSGPLPMTGSVLEASEIPGFSELSASSSTTIIGALSTITVRMVGNTWLGAGTSINITGLVDTCPDRPSETVGPSVCTNLNNPSDPAFALSGSGAAAFGGSGNWGSQAGVLALRLVSSVDAGTELVVSFVLRNKGKMHNGGSVILRVDGLMTQLEEEMEVLGDGHSALIMRTGQGREIMPGETISFTLQGVKVRSWSGSTGVYQVMTMKEDMTVLDQDLMVSPDIIYPGACNVSIQLFDAVVGNKGDVTVLMRTSNPIPPMGSIHVWFPDGFQLDSGKWDVPVYDEYYVNGGREGLSVSSSNMDLSVRIATSGSFVLDTGLNVRQQHESTAIVTNQGSALPALSLLNFTLHAVQYPVASIAGGTYLVRTFTAESASIDEDVDIAGPTYFNPGSLFQADVQPGSLRAGEVTFLTVSFVTANPIPPDGHIEVLLPDGFITAGNQDLDPILIENWDRPRRGTAEMAVDFEAREDPNLPVYEPVGSERARNLAAEALDGLDGNLTVQVMSSRHIRVWRQGETTSFRKTRVRVRIYDPTDEYSVSYPIIGVQNPSVSGLTGTYQVQTRLYDGTIIDEDLAIRGDVLRPGALQHAMVRPVSLVAGSTSGLLMSFSVVNPLPVNSSIRIDLPTDTNMADISVNTDVNVSITGSTTLGSLDGELVGQALDSQTLSLMRRNGSVTVQPCIVDLCGTENIVGVGVERYSSGNAPSVSVSAFRPDAQWRSGPTLPHYVEYDFGTAVSVCSFSFQSRGTDILGYLATDGPTAYQLLGSEDGVTYIVLHNTSSSLPWSSTQERRAHQLFVSAYFRYFRLQITDVPGRPTGNKYTVIRDLQFTAPSGADPHSATAMTQCRVSIAVQGPFTTRQYSGPTRPYIVSTVDAYGRVMDQATIPGSVLLPNMLLNAAVVPRSTLAGAVTFVQAIFTLSNPLPADGEIEVEFPMEVNLDSVQVTVTNAGVVVPPMAVTDSAGINGSMLVHVVGQSVFLTRDGTGGVVAAGSTVMMEFYGVKNQQVSGLGGVYAIRTKLHTGAVIDADEQVTPTMFTIPNLINASVMLGSDTAGAIDTVEIVFTTANPIPADGRVRFTLPEEYVLLEPLSAVWAFGADGLLTAIIDDDGSVLLSRDGEMVIPQDTRMMVRLSTVTNVPRSGSSLAFQLCTMTHDFRVMDCVAPDCAGCENASAPIQPHTMLPAQLIDATVEPGRLVTGYNGLTVRMKVVNRLPANGALQIDIPSTFAVLTPGASVSGLQVTPSECPQQDNPLMNSALPVSPAMNSPASPDLASIVVIMETVNASMDMNASIRLTITSSSGQLALDRGSTLRLDLMNVGSPEFVGPSGTFRLTTLTEDGIVIDRDWAVPSVDIGVGQLLDTSVEQSSLIAGSVVTLVVKLRTEFNAMDEGSTIDVVLPPSYSPYWMDTTYRLDSSAGMMTGNLSFADGGTRLRLKVPSRISGDLVLNLYNIRAQNFSGPTGVFQVQTWTPSDVLMDQDVGVPGFVMRTAALSQARISMVDSTAGTRSRMLVEFIPANPLPADCRIAVVLPAGFHVGLNSSVAVPVGNGKLLAGSSLLASEFDAEFALDGALEANVHADVLVTVKRDGSGTSAASDTRVAFFIDEVRNPQYTGVTGTFQLRTLLAGGVPIDEDLAVPGIPISPGNFTGMCPPFCVEPAVRPTQLLAGARVDMSVVFVLSNPWPADGQVEVTLPRDAVLAAVSGVDAGTVLDGNPTYFSPTRPGPVLDGGLQFVVRGQTVRVRRDGAGREIETGEFVSLTIMDVNNQNYEGDTGPSIIRTERGDGTLIDTAVVNGFELLPIRFSQLEMVKSTSLAGELSKLTVSFATSGFISRGSRLRIDFSGENADRDGSAWNLVASGPVIPSEWLLSIPPGSKTIDLFYDGADRISPDEVTSIEVFNVGNPNYVQTVVYVVLLLTPGVGSVSSHRDSDTLSYTVGNLSKVERPTVSPPTLASSEGPMTVTLRPQNPVPIDGKIQVDLPSGFTFVTPCEAIAIEGINGTLEFEVGRFGCGGLRSAMILRMGDGDEVLAGASVVLELNTIRTQSFAGLSGEGRITTLTSDDAQIDTGTTPPVGVAVAALTEAQISTGTNVAGATTWLEVMFIPSSPIPNDGLLMIQCPPGLTILEPPQYTSLMGQPAKFEILPDTFRYYMPAAQPYYDLGGISQANRNPGQPTDNAYRGATVTLRRIAGPGIPDIPPYDAVRFRFPAVQLRPWTGCSGTFQVSTMLSGFVLLDSDLSVDGAVLVPGTLQDVSVQVSSMLPDALVNVTVNFTLATQLPPDSELHVTFPPGYRGLEYATVSAQYGMAGELQVVSDPGNMRLAEQFGGATVVRLKHMANEITPAGSQVYVVLSGLSNRFFSSKAQAFHVKTLLRDGITQVDRRIGVVVPPVAGPQRAGFGVFTDGEWVMAFNEQNPREAFRLAQLEDAGGITHGVSALDVEGGAMFFVSGGKLMQVNLESPSLAQVQLRVDSATMGGFVNMEWDPVAGRLIGLALLDGEMVMATVDHRLGNVTRLSAEARLPACGACECSPTQGVSALDPVARIYYMSSQLTLLAVSAEDGRVLWQTSVVMGASGFQGFASLEFDSVGRPGVYAPRGLMGMALRGDAVELVQIDSRTGDLHTLAMVFDEEFAGSIVGGVSALTAGSERYLALAQARLLSIDLNSLVVSYYATPGVSEEGEDAASGGGGWSLMEASRFMPPPESETTESSADSLEYQNSPECVGALDITVLGLEDSMPIKRGGNGNFFSVTIVGVDVAVGDRVKIAWDGDCRDTILGGGPFPITSAGSHSQAFSLEFQYAGFAQFCYSRDDGFDEVFRPLSWGSSRNNPTFFLTVASFDVVPTPLPVGTPLSLELLGALSPADVLKLVADDGTINPVDLCSRGPLYAGTQPITLAVDGMEVSSYSGGAVTRVTVDVLLDSGGGVPLRVCYQPAGWTEFSLLLGRSRPDSTYSWVTGSVLEVEDGGSSGGGGNGGGGTCTTEFGQ